MERRGQTSTGGSPSVEVWLGDRAVREKGSKFAGVQAARWAGLVHQGLSARALVAGRRHIREGRGRLGMALGLQTQLGDKVREGFLQEEAF